MNDFEFVAKLQDVIAKAAGLKRGRKDLLANETVFVAKFRTVAMYLARTHTNLGVQELGKLFDRDHSTISAAVRRETILLQHNAPPPKRIGGKRADWHASLLAQVRAEESSTNA